MDWKSQTKSTSEDRGIELFGASVVSHLETVGMSASAQKILSAVKLMGLAGVALLILDRNEFNCHLPCV